MGKCKDPKRLLVDERFKGSPELQDMTSKGHTITFMDFSAYELVIGPTCQMTPLGRIGYVMKKLKEIVKEVAK